MLRCANGETDVKDMIVGLATMSQSFVNDIKREFAGLESRSADTYTKR